jgi:hypothetical protein
MTAAAAAAAAATMQNYVHINYKLVRYSSQDVLSPLPASQPASIFPFQMQIVVAMNVAMICYSVWPPLPPPPAAQQKGE